MSRYFTLRLERDGVTKYCTNVGGFPVDMDFDERESPFQFADKEDAKEFWRLYQKNKPADASGWIYQIEEHEI